LGVSKLFGHFNAIPTEQTEAFELFLDNNGYTFNDLDDYLYNIGKAQEHLDNANDDDYAHYETLLDEAQERFYDAESENSEVIEKFQEAFQGEYDDVEEWARELIDNCYSLPEFALRYFDYESFANDCECGGDIYTIDSSCGTVYVFNNY
jgi:predicted nuclease with TOPRIM domain